MKERRTLWNNLYPKRARIFVAKLHIEKSAGVPHLLRHELYPRCIQDAEHALREYPELSHLIKSQPPPPISLPKVYLVNVLPIQ